MANAARQKARKAARDAQARYARKQTGLEEAHAARRKTFAEAQAAGLSLREIAEATGLHWTRVGQILREK
jgi:hypothetical protein